MLIQASNNIVELQLVFSDTDNISKDLREPDTLLVKIKLPDAFIDAET